MDHPENHGKFRPQYRPDHSDIVRVDEDMITFMGGGFPVEGALRLIEGHLFAWSTTCRGQARVRPIGSRTDD